MNKTNQNDWQTRASPYIRIAHDFPTPAFTLPPRVINDHALLYFKHGAGRFWVAGEKDFAIQPGDLYIVRPNVEHGFEGRGHPFYMLNIHFDLVERPDSRVVHYNRAVKVREHARAVESISARDKLDSVHGALPVQMRIRNTAAYERLFFRVHSLFALNDTASKLQLKAAMIDLVAFLYQQQQAERIAPKLLAQLPALERAVQFMQANFRVPLTHEQAAEHAGLSRSYFARCFKEYYCISPMRFLMQIRIERAKSELILDRRPIKAIAQAVGFESVHHFTRSFSRLAGVSPALFRSMYAAIPRPSSAEEK